MDEERRKRVRADEGEQDNNKNTKLAKRPQSEQSLYDHHRHSEFSDGVFDFPWMKDGVGISRSEEWKLEEDSFMTQLRDWIISNNNAEEYSTITTATGIEFSLSLLPDQMIIGDLDPHFPDELSTSSSVIEEHFGFDTAETNLDCIWTAFT